MNQTIQKKLTKIISTAVDCNKSHRADSKHCEIWTKERKIINYSHAEYYLPRNKKTCENSFYQTNLHKKKEYNINYRKKISCQ